MPKHDELGHAKNLQAFLRAHSTPDGTPNSGAWRQGLMDFMQLDVDASILWSPIGPAPLVIDADTFHQGTGPDSGEVTDISIFPDGSADKTIYIATNDGGIWRTSNGGLTWEPTMDELAGLSMGAVAVDPSSASASQVIYAGTGNAYDGGREFNKGIGLYRSSDSGATWSIVDGGPLATVLAGMMINAIGVPATDVVLVATDQGLFHSVDGGQNFGANTTHDDRKPVISGLITCLVLDAASPTDTFYVGVSGVGVIKYTPNTATTQTNLFSSSNGAPAPPFNNIEVGQSEQNPAVLYVSVQVGRQTQSNSDYRGFYQSVNGGANWTLLPSVRAVASGDGFGQTDYDLTLGIDPQVAVSASAPLSGLIYVGFQELWLSQNGGQTFLTPACTSSQAHWDQHVIKFSPKANRTAAAQTPAYIGTDGGIYQSKNGGGTWSQLNGDIGSNLFFGIDIGKGSAANNAYTYGGCQDTGTVGHRPTDSGTEWHAGIDGDGGKVAVDPTDPQTVYGFDDGGLIKTSDSGNTWLTTGIGAGLPTPQFPTLVAIALELNGTDPTKRVVYIGMEKSLYKSSDAGATFSATTLSPGTYVVAVATTTADSNRIWAGAWDGSVHYSADAGATWDQGSFQAKPNPANMPVTGIAIDPDTPGRVAVVYGGLSGLHSAYRTQHIFLTEDNGQTWSDISGTDGKGPTGNLPDSPLHSVVFDKTVTPAVLIVAGDAGVMRSMDFTVNAGAVTATWKAYGVGLPTVSCSSLAIDNSQNPPVLRVGTYGRSCFELTRPSGPQLYVLQNLGFGAVATGTSGSLLLYAYNCGDAALSITGINIVGSADFALNPAPTFPVSIAPGATQSFTLAFTPAATGDQTALLSINSNDPHSPFALSASGRGVTPKAPRLATNPMSATSPVLATNPMPATPVDFGLTDESNPRSITLQLFNVGTTQLQVQSINQSGSSDFSITPAPAFPINIAPGAESDVTITYKPSGNGLVSAQLAIASNDPQAPTTTLNIQGTGTGNAVSGSLWPVILTAVGAAVVVGGVVTYEELKKS